MSEKSSEQPDKQSASKKRTLTEGPVEEVQAKGYDAAAAYRSLAGGQTLSSRRGSDAAADSRQSGGYRDHQPGDGAAPRW